MNGEKCFFCFSAPFSITKFLNRFHQFVLTLVKCVQHSVFRQWKIIKLISLSTLSSNILNWRKVWDTNNNNDIKMLSIWTALQMGHLYYHNFHLKWLLTVVTKKTIEPSPNGIENAPFFFVQLKNGFQQWNLFAVNSQQMEKNTKSNILWAHFESEYTSII